MAADFRLFETVASAYGELIVLREREPRARPKKFPDEIRKHVTGCRSEKRALALAHRKVKQDAFNSSPGSPDRGGSIAVAGKSLHSDAVIHQVDSERRRGDRRGSVASEPFRTIPLYF
jgi:hypothetical protein